MAVVSPPMGCPQLAVSRSPSVIGRHGKSYLAVRECPMWMQAGHPGKDTNRYHDPDPRYDASGNYAGDDSCSRTFRASVIASCSAL
jgi:hypothetical protein